MNTIQLAPLRHLEWEELSIPLVVSNLQFSGSDLPVEDNFIIEISRGEDYQLKAVLKGCTFEPQIFTQHHRKENSHIAEGYTINGKDEQGNEVTLNKCYLNGFRSSNVNGTENGYYLECDVIIDTCEISRTDFHIDDNSTVQLEWLITASTRAILRGSTLRKGHPYNRRYREGLDEIPAAIADDYLAATSNSRDYMKVNIPGGYFIFSLVPKELTPDWFQGICMEYHENEPGAIAEVTKNFIRKFLSFLLGSTLIPVGHSLVIDNEVVFRVYEHPSADHIRKQCDMAFPPVHFNFQYDWGNLGWLAQTMIEKYLSVCEILQLHQVIERYFLALRIPVGVNLPVLANALEILSTNYLKAEGKFNEHLITDEEFVPLLAPEIEKIADKLGHREGAENILRKIQSANRRNPAEKTGLFLQLVGITPGKQEKQALALRNKMTHSARDYSDDATADNDVVMTRVYQVLFNRILLKLLGYSEFYIDYSQYNVRAKHINLPAGKSVAEQ